MKNTKIIVIILKVLMFIATGVCAVVFNLLGSVSVLATGQAEEMGITGIVIFWLLFTVICYITPVFLVMFKKYVISAVLSVCGMICVLVLNEILKNTASELYLQLLIITIIAILIAVFGNWDKLHEHSEKREKEKNRAAPSILGGTAKSGESFENKKKGAPSKAQGSNKHAKKKK